MASDLDQFAEGPGAELCCAAASLCKKIPETETDSLNFNQKSLKILHSGISSGACFHLQFVDFISSPEFSCEFYRRPRLETGFGNKLGVAVMSLSGLITGLTVGFFLQLPQETR